MLKWLFGPKEEYRLCKTITQGSVLTETNKLTGEESKTEGKIYYHLLESNKGNRKCEVEGLGKGTNPSEQWKQYVYGTEIYQMTVYPWLHGRMNPEIPTYQDVPVQEMKDYLSKQ